MWERSQESAVVIKYHMNATATLSYIHYTKFIYTFIHYSFRRSTVTKTKPPDQTSQQAQAAIGHSTPVHRGGHVQNMIRHRQAHRGKIGPEP